MRTRASEVFGRSCQAAIKAHLKCWRQVKKKPALAKAPTFWEIAAKRKLLLPTFITSSPRIRNMLDAHASFRNVFSKNCVLDVSQSSDRVAMRTNGDMLTLTRTCSSIFAPYFGSTMSVAQCFALQGGMGVNRRQCSVSHLDMLCSSLVVG
jgi:hypothetical protein